MMQDTYSVIVKGECRSGLSGSSSKVGRGGVVIREHSTEHSIGD